MLIAQQTYETGEERQLFWCQGCNELHQVCTKQGNAGPGPVWGYNHDPEKPTITPSILTTMHRPEERKCHIFITDGVVDFLGDCWHELRGTKQSMVDIPIEGLKHLA